ncbi:hypothetical protein EZJ49_15965 [Bdellovibrio bacteriovorus]|uniref:hypothetical protein n=1 Tax=Bdellovibrio bacteriovorus TaxID=959 RepID=UPI0021D1A63C|nr:hypothetical protein [Bdellovibrio bacteriovorus]UXR64566.1 hypothetical protein EZJ49_15965 [Bdellovibrio bacteriovorus]
MKKWLAVVVIFFAVSVQAQSRFSYDLSGASGSRDGESFTEIHLGLNYFVTDWLNWRNSVFTQFGTDINTVYGLDTAGLFNYELYNSNRTLGIEFFAGPGLRFASENSNAAFGKAGVTFGLGGLRIGAGVQQFHYFEDRKDKNDNTLNKDETQYFITLSGGGSF